MELANEEVHPISDASHTVHVDEVQYTAGFMLLEKEKQKKKLRVHARLWRRVKV